MKGNGQQVALLEEMDKRKTWLSQVHETLSPACRASAPPAGAELGHTGDTSRDLAWFLSDAVAAQPLFAKMLLFLLRQPYLVSQAASTPVYWGCQGHLTGMRKSLLEELARLGPVRDEARDTYAAAGVDSHTGLSSASRGSTSVGSA